MTLPVRKVVAAGWYCDGDSMGTLVDEGIMTKHTGRVHHYHTEDIVWTLHHDAGVIIDNGVDDLIYPGQSVRWEK